MCTAGKSSEDPGYPPASALGGAWWDIGAELRLNLEVDAAGEFPAILRVERGSWLTVVCVCVCVCPPSCDVLEEFGVDGNGPRGSVR